MTESPSQHSPSESAGSQIAPPAPADRVLIFARIFRRWPEISVAAVVLTAIFNVGYYSQIGLHFLGTADFTNFVYSFGLTFGILVSTLQSILLFADNFLSFSERPNAWIKFRKLFLIAAIAVAAILVYGLVAPNAYTPNLLRLGNPWVFVVVFSTMSIMGLMANYLWFRYRVIKLEDLWFLFFNMVMAVFMFGRAIAYDQIFSPQLYSIITHDSTISDAALVRSSSMGFIISINGTIMFLPTGEVRQIIAKKKLEQN